jgi:hypothetical protein
MEKMIERTCRNCGNKRSASFIAFCPHCSRFDYSECEYVSPVTECTVFMGDEKIGAVNAYTDDNCESDDNAFYDISVPVVGISETLKTKGDPLIAVTYVISDKVIKPLTKEIHLFDTYVAGVSYLKDKTQRQTYTAA